jgi:hypothetical protein
MRMRMWDKLCRSPSEKSLMSSILLCVSLSLLLFYSAVVLQGQVVPRTGSLPVKIHPITMNSLDDLLSLLTARDFHTRL